MKKIILISVSLCFGVDGMRPIADAPLDLSQNKAVTLTPAEHTEMEDTELDGVLSSFEQLELSESDQVTKTKALSGRDLWRSLSTLISPFKINLVASAHPVDTEGAGKAKPQELTKAQVAALFDISPKMNTKEVYFLNRKFQNRREKDRCRQLKGNTGYFKKK